MIFTGMGLFMSVVAELYRRNRDKAAAYDREAALRESQARLATFAAATFEGIVESEAGRIVDCNEQFARMLGYSVAELKGMEIASLIAPEDRDRVMANILQGRESTIEHAMLRKDGTRIVVEAHGRPVSPGSARRHTAIRDITERKRAEEALRESERRERERAEELAVLFEAVPMPVFIAREPECLHLTGNRLADEILRISHGNELSMSGPAETQAAPFQGRQGWARVEARRTPAQRAARGEHIKDFEFSIVFDDGMVRHVLGYGTPLLDDQGRPRGTVAVLVDMTERKRAEESLRQLNAQQEAANQGPAQVAPAAFNLMQDADTARRQAERAEEALRRRGAELQTMNDELARFNRVAVNRELRMIELKKEINALCAQLGQPKKYPLEFEKELT